MEENITFERVIGRKGDVPAISLPPEVMKWMDLKLSDIVEIMPVSKEDDRILVISKKK